MIDTDEKLGAFLPAVRDAKWIALDTEADSLHAYPEKVCLIQLSTVAGDELVDPLGNLDLKPLLSALTAHALIMHGADYDLRLLRKHHEFVPGAIFDTMLAARLLGLRQFGLSSLVEQYLGVKLEKGSQKANWARRPLTERMEQYARNDTHHLKALSDKLRAELETKGRLAWHEEACAKLIDDCTRMSPADTDSVWRVKGSHVLSGPALAVLRELWQWREDEAVGANKPPYFILAHEKMIEVAEAAAAKKSWEAALPHHLTERRRAGVTKAVKAGLQVSPEKFPGQPRRTNHWPTEQERKRFTELQKKRDAKAEALGLDATVIASKAELSNLARDWGKHAGELMSWQRELMS